MPRRPPCPKYLTKTESIAPKSEPKTDMSFLTQCTPFDLWAMDDDLLSGILPASGSNKVSRGFCETTCCRTYRCSVSPALL
jgi:hypothetical protein